MTHYCSFTGWFRHFLSNQKGIAAVEFALIAPVLLFLYLGATDLTQALAIDRKLGIFASTVSDLVAQEKQISDNDIKGLVEAGAAIMRPFPTDDTALLLTIFQVKDGSSSVTCNWPDRSGPNAGILPDEIMGLAEGQYVVLASARDDYKPMFGTIFNTSMPLEQRSLHIVRQQVEGFTC